MFKIINLIRLKLHFKKYYFCIINRTTRCFIRYKILIPENLSNKMIYHFTPFENLKEMIQNGNLILKSKSTCNPAKDISEQSIQHRRASTPIPFNEKTSVHDYVPFYFCSRCPMLLGVIKRGEIDQHDIIYFEFPIKVLENYNGIFTDASINTQVRPNFYNDLSKLQNLSWNLIDSNNWSFKNDDDRHKKMAEALIYGSINISEANYCVVWDEEIKKDLEKFIKDNKILNFPQIIFESSTRRHWYVNFNHTDTNLNGCSVEQGPKEKSSGKYRIAYSS